MSENARLAVSDPKNHNIMLYNWIDAMRRANLSV